MYVTNYGAARGIDTELIDKVSTIDSLTNEIVDTVSVGGMPHGVADNQIYVSNTVSGTVSVIKPKADNNNPISSIPVGILPGNGNTGVAYNSNYGKIYVTNLKANSVYFVSTSRNEIMASIPVGAAPSAIAYDSENDKIDVPNSTLAPSRGTISVINGSTDNVFDNIHIGVGPNGIAYNPNNGKIYVDNMYSNDIYIIDGSNNKLVTSIPADGVVYNSANNDTYVANYDSNTVSVIHHCDYNKGWL